MRLYLTDLITLTVPDLNHNSDCTITIIVPAAPPYPTFQNFPELFITFHNFKQERNRQEYAAFLLAQDLNSSPNKNVDEVEANTKAADKKAAADKAEANKKADEDKNRQEEEAVSAKVARDKKAAEDEKAWEEEAKAAEDNAKEMEEAGLSDVEVVNPMPNPTSDLSITLSLTLTLIRESGFARG